MDPVSRRTFIKGTSAAIAAVGAATVLPAGVANAVLKRGPNLPVRPLAGGAVGASATARSGDALIALVRDVASGEVEILYGTESVVVHDESLASRLHAATGGY